MYVVSEVAGTGVPAELIIASLSSTVDFTVVEAVFVEIVTNVVDL